MTGLRAFFCFVVMAKSDINNLTDANQLLPKQFYQVFFKFCHEDSHCRSKSCKSFVKLLFCIDYCVLANHHSTNGRLHSEEWWVTTINQLPLISLFLWLVMVKHKCKHTYMLSTVVWRIVASTQWYLYKHRHPNVLSMIPIKSHFVQKPVSVMKGELWKP